MVTNLSLGNREEKMNQLHRSFPILRGYAVKMEDTPQPDSTFAFSSFLQLLYDLLCKYLGFVAQKRKLYIFCMGIMRGWFQGRIWYLAVCSITEQTSLVLISKVGRMNVGWLGAALFVITCTITNMMLLIPEGPWSISVDKIRDSQGLRISRLLHFNHHAQILFIACEFPSLFQQLHSYFIFLTYRR